MQPLLRARVPVEQRPDPRQICGHVACGDVAPVDNRVEHSARTDQHILCVQIAVQPACLAGIWRGQGGRPEIVDLSGNQVCFLPYPEHPLKRVLFPNAQWDTAHRIFRGICGCRLVKCD